MHERYEITAPLYLTLTLTQAANIALVFLTQNPRLTVKPVVVPQDLHAIYTNACCQTVRTAGSSSSSLLGCYMQSNKANVSW